MWTWMGGNMSINQYGVYGTLGVSSPSNVPGARYGAVGWFNLTDGSAWIFGGFGE